MEGKENVIMKKSVSAIMAALMAASVVLAGCGSGNTGATAAETAAGTTAGAAAETSAAETSAAETQPETTPPETEAEKVPATLTGDTGDNCQAGVRVGLPEGPHLHGTGVSDGQGPEGRNGKPL